jgi:hypothetical protein
MATRLGGPPIAGAFVVCVYRGLRDAVSPTFDAVAQRWVRGGSGGSQCAEVGLHFGHGRWWCTGFARVHRILLSGTHARVRRMVSATTATTRREPTMSQKDQKELQKQKMQAKIDEWRAELDKLEAQARGASADARLKLDEQMKDLRSRIDEGKSALAALAEKGEEAWASFKEKAASTWDATKTAYEEGVSGSEPKK